MSNYDPFDFAGIRREQAAWRATARDTFVSGIDPADMKPGMKVTISPNLRQGDRSYTTEILEVVAINSGHVQVRFSRPHCGATTTILHLHEHHFYAADHFDADVVEVAAED